MKHLPLFFSLAAALTLVLSPVLADPVAVGAPAPTPKAPDQSGKVVDFGDVYKKGLTLVYFYPKSGTPGCTAEACSLRDAYSDLSAKGLQIIGVSRDGVEAQQKFHIKFNLPFTLVSDDGSVSKAFGVPSIAMGMLDSRQSFIVKDGTVVWESLKAQTKSAADEVQKALTSLK